jgi:hypothetical protein
LIIRFKEWKGGGPSDQRSLAQKTKLSMFMF